MFLNNSDKLHFWCHQCWMVHQYLFQAWWFGKTKKPGVLKPLWQLVAHAHRRSIFIWDLPLPAAKWTSFSSFRASSSWSTTLLQWTSTAVDSIMAEIQRSHKRRINILKQNRVKAEQELKSGHCLEHRRTKRSCKRPDEGSASQVRWWSHIITHIQPPVCRVTGSDVWAV